MPASVLAPEWACTKGGQHTTFSCCGDESELNVWLEVARRPSAGETLFRETMAAAYQYEMNGLLSENALVV